MESLTFRLRSFALGPLVSLVLAALLCAACGSPGIITGRPPFVGIADMRLADGLLRTDFRIDNQNGVPMNVESIEIEVMAGGASLIRENRPLNLAIDANSAEEVRVEQRPGDEARALLDSLERREVNSLSFELSGRVLTQEDGYLRFEQKGHLYPVPGRPGSYRSAVTQAQELRREEKL
jgi:hypothetical protein